MIQCSDGGSVRIALLGVAALAVGPIACTYDLRVGPRVGSDAGPGASGASFAPYAPMDAGAGDGEPTGAPPVLRSGDITAFPLPHGGVCPMDLVLAPDGALWFSEFQANALGRVKLDGTIQEFPYVPNLFGLSGASPDQPPEHLTVGSDGFLWFTEGRGGGIFGRMSLAGEHADFLDPPNLWVAMMLLGPGGNLWFADPFGGAIGELTPMGTFDRFTLPLPVGFFPGNSSTAPTDLVLCSGASICFVDGFGFGRIEAGQAVMTCSLVRGAQGLLEAPDGSLWGGRAQSNLLDRCDPATEQVSTFAADSIVRTMGVGPDGAVWVGTVGNQIERFGPDGARTIFPVPIAGQPTRILGGPDGNVWVTQQVPAKIVRVSPSSGKVTVFDLPGGSDDNPNLAFTPDGNLWFTSCNGDYVAKLALPPD
jgi:virginiamycin B lyase